MNLAPQWDDPLPVRLLLSPFPFPTSGSTVSMVPPNTTPARSPWEFSASLYAQF